MKFLGEPKEFLGIKINGNQDKGIIELNQIKFITKMQHKFGYSDMEGQTTPMITNQVLNRERKLKENKQENDQIIKQREYREITGSLLYLENVTRPDMSYAVNVLSRHQLNPTIHEWNMISRVFRYLEYSKNFSLISKGLSSQVDVFSGASFSDCKGSLTTSGYIIKLFGDTVARRTRKQTYVALSTCQAEYVALSDACREAIELSLTLKEIPSIISYPLTLLCDNKAAIVCTQTDGGTRLRHMTEVQEDYVKQFVEIKYIKLNWIASKEQRADIFTKPLLSDTHSRLTKLLLNNSSFICVCSRLRRYGLTLCCNRRMDHQMCSRRHAYDFDA